MPFSINGVPVEKAGDLPARKEIVEWYNRSKSGTDKEALLQVSLYIHALSRFQSTAFYGPNGELTLPNDAELSYYRVAGIHGQPRIDWGGEKGGKFCAHQNSAFPTWHRPYLSLWEQLIYGHMLAFLNDPKTKYAGTYAKNDWIAAAKTWRLPYWNYAVRPALPEIASLQSIVVYGTEGTNVTFKRNPVYSFKPRGPSGELIGFGDVPEQLSLPRPIFAKATETFRSSDEVVKHDLENKMEHTPNAGPGKAQGVISEAVARLMTESYFRNYTLFASTRYTTVANPEEWLSLEGLHNSIHGSVGGFMGDPGYAAFDPIFWHHHCFIDLIFDSWQYATKDTKWFNSDFAATLRKDVSPADDKDYPLRPFFNGSTKKLYTSDNARHVSAFGYQYDLKLPSTNVEVQKAIGVSLRRMVNSKLSMTRAETAEFLPADRKTDNDLVVNVRYNRFAINGGEPYWVHIFVGDVGEPAGYISNPDRVGSVYNFSSPVGESGCENCKTQIEGEELATGQVPITGAILKDWRNDRIPELPSSGPFDEHTVERYLAEKLNWRVITANGQPVATESVPDLKVFVLLGDADHSTDEHVESKFTNYEYLWGVTANKVGGGTAADI